MTVRRIFDTLEYGPALESHAEALAWIAKHKARFGHFIGGAWSAPKAGFKSRNPATGKVLATLSQARQTDVDAAVKAAHKAQPAWAKAGGPARARILYALARLLQKHSRLFAVLETLDNGKPIRESRDIDIPLAQRHFYYHAGLAQLFEQQNAGRQAHGVCGQIIPWNFPLLMLAWKIAPALAAGNTLVLKPAEYTSLTALLFAEICMQAGVPAGVVNIITGDGTVGEMITHANIQKIAFTGSTKVGQQIAQNIAGSGKALTLELGGKSPYIIFDDADIPSAIEGLVDTIWFNQGQVCCAGSRLIVQESIAERFFTELKKRMNKLRMGNPLDKSIDMGAIVDPVQLERIKQLVAQNSAGSVFHADIDVPKGCFYPPTLITGLHPADMLMQKEIFGPVLVATTFRTMDEAAQLANNSRYGLAASIWSENINAALGLAPKLRAGVVWVNSTNMFDAAAPFGGVKESGFGREGGQEGLRAYTRPAPNALRKPPAPARHKMPVKAIQSGGPAVERTAKLYIGGKQVRPDGGHSQALYTPKGAFIAHIPLAGRKDVRNAIEAQHKAAAAWGSKSAYNRAQILYYIAENISARADDLTQKLIPLMPPQKARTQVAQTIDTLFTFAAWADEFSGTIKTPPIRGLALALREPTGCIAALCADDAPLLGLALPMAAALAMGNTITLAPSDPCAAFVADFYQILETSDVPAGCVNILTGNQSDLAPHLGTHLDVQALWCLCPPDISAQAARGAHHNLKRVWYGAPADDTQSWLEAATEVKTIWIPYGD